MTVTIQDFLGDGDGPATVGQKEETRGPLLVMSRPVTVNWRVGREGEIVTFRIGNSTLRLNWRDAIQIGHALGVKGFEGKVQAGQMGKRVEMRE